MAFRPSITSGLQLEMLEDRTLLALALEFPWLDAAVDTDSSHEFEYIWFPSDSQITLKGNNTGSLVINVDYLPNNVKNVAAYSFTDVSVVGTRGIDRLFAADLGSLHIEIPVHISLVTEDVEILGLVEAAPFTLLEGDRTYFEANNLSDTFLYSDLESLDLQINDPESSLWLLSLNPDQTVRTNFVPEDFKLIGLEDSQLGILGEEPGIQNDVDSLLALDPQKFESNNFDLEAQEPSAADPTVYAEGANDLGKAAFEQSLPLAGVESAFAAAITSHNSENDEAVDESGINYEALFSYFLDNYYKSGAWLPHQYVADDREPVDEMDYDSLEGDLYASIERDSGIVIESPFFERDKEQEVTATEPTWLGKVELRLNEMLARSNNTRLSLGEHLLMRASNEFTPGERPGLIVDTKAPSRNNFNQSVIS